MSGKHWTDEEEDAWAGYFRGDLSAPPKGRTIEAALRRLQPDLMVNLADQEIAHKTSAAALRHLSHVPFKREGDPVRFIRDVQSSLERPWLRSTYAHDWPPAVFDAALSDARGALHG